MKNVIVILAMVFISQIVKGQDYMIDIKSQKGLVRQDKWLPCIEKDFFTVVCADKCGMSSNINCYLFTWALKYEVYDYVINKCNTEYESYIYNGKKVWKAEDPYGTGTYKITIWKEKDCFWVEMNRIKKNYNE